MRLVWVGILFVALSACSERRAAPSHAAAVSSPSALPLALTDYQLAGGAIRFRAPAHWHVVQAPKPGDDDAAIFHIRNAATDSGSDRTNVIVWVLHGPATTPFREATDQVLAGSLNGLVLEDTLLGRMRDTADPERRFVFWRGQQGTTGYMLFDDFSRRDT